MANPMASLVGRFRRCSGSATCDGGGPSPARPCECVRAKERGEKGTEACLPPYLAPRRGRQEERAAVEEMDAGGGGFGGVACEQELGGDGRGRAGKGNLYRVR